MQKKFLSFLFLIFFAFADAQTKKIELIDLVKLLTPDATTVNKMLSWNTNETVNASVKWNSVAAKKQGNSWEKAGTPELLFSGKPMTCVDNVSDKKHPCKWNISLRGKQQGYTHFTLGTTDFPVNQPGEEIDLLFPGNKQWFSLQKNCMEGAIMWTRLYKVAIPGKMISWMFVEYESLSATASQYENNGAANSFSVYFYFDKKEADSLCQ